MSKEDANYPRAKVFGILQSGHRLLVEEFDGEHSRGRGIYYRPIGGSIEFGEKSIDALIREFKEELKEAVEIESFIGCIENIFMINEKLGHEMILVYKVGFVDKENYNRDLFYIQENEKVSVVKWIDIMDFVKGEKVLFPDGLLNKLKRGKLMNQQQMSERNKVGWNQNAYEAWVTRHGSPNDYANELMADPSKKVSYYLDEIGDVEGKRVLNLLGSKGNKAVCFALLGADVTVVDLSSENKRYAMELAKAAGVSITYIVKDVLELTEEEITPCDIVILEMGVLHYFIDLHPLFQKISKLMNNTGIFIIRDYHPFNSKILRLKEGKAVLDGDYFKEEFLEVEVAYSQLLPIQVQQKLEKNIIRQWMLSEVVNALVNSDLKLQKMKEDKGVHWAFPTGSPEGIAERFPGTFTIIASKAFQEV